jgi:hypothetical protein
MTKTELIDYFGSQQRFAELVSAAWPAYRLTQTAVSQWDKVPAVRQLQAEALSNGAILADPDIPRGWRNQQQKHVLAREAA